MRRLFTFLTILASAACTSPHEEPLVFRQVWRFDAGEAPDGMDGRIRRIGYLPLEQTPEADFRKIDKLVCRNGRIYVGDFFSKRIIAFDTAGHHLFTVDRHGRGPGEYLEIKSFAADDKHIHLLDNFSRRMHSYDCLTGAYTGSKPLPVVAWDLETLADGGFLLAFVPLQGGAMAQAQPPYRIFITDSDLNIVRMLFPYEEGEREPLARTTYLTASGDSVVFSSFRFDGFTLFDRSDPERFFHTAIDFDRKIPVRDRFDARALMSDRYTYLAQTPVLGGGCAALDICVGEWIETYLYDSGTERFLANSPQTAAERLFPPLAYCEGRLVSLLPNERYAELVARGFPRAAPEVERRILADEAVLLLYDLF